MKKAAFIIPYFGKLPNYFGKWLESVKCNPQWDFVFFTDCNMDLYCLPPNVFIHTCTFEDVRTRILRKMNGIAPPSIIRKLSLNNPYKLCDYRNLYGAIFSEYLVEYEFWGYCDIDLVFGRLDDFITDEIMSDYDKIGTRGHLTLYRNIEEFKSINWLISSGGWIATYASFAITHNYMSHIDESPDVDQYLESRGYRVYSDLQIADIAYQALEFHLVGKNGGVSETKAFCFDNGNLTSIENGTKFAYIHFQKRNMLDTCAETLSFYMIPNKFVAVLPSNLEIEPSDAKCYERNMTWKLFLRRIRRLPAGLAFRFLKRKFR